MYFQRALQNPVWSHVVCFLWVKALLQLHARYTFISRSQPQSCLFKGKASQNNHSHPTLQLPDDYNCLQGKHVIIAIHPDTDMHILPYFEYEACVQAFSICNVNETYNRMSINKNDNFIN